MISWDIIGQDRTELYRIGQDKTGYVKVWIEQDRINCTGPYTLLNLFYTVQLGPLLYCTGARVARCVYTCTILALFTIIQQKELKTNYVYTHKFNNHSFKYILLLLFYYYFQFGKLRKFAIRIKIEFFFYDLQSMTVAIIANKKQL